MVPRKTVSYKKRVVISSSSYLICFVFPGDVIITSLPRMSHLLCNGANEMKDNGVADVPIGVVKREVTLMCENAVLDLR